MPTAPGLLVFSEHDLRFLHVAFSVRRPVQKNGSQSKSRNRTPEISLQVLMDILSHHNLTKRQRYKIQKEQRNRSTSRTYFKRLARGSESNTTMNIFHKGSSDLTNAIVRSDWEAVKVECEAHPKNATVWSTRVGFLRRRARKPRSSDPLCGCSLRTEGCDRGAGAGESRRSQSERNIIQKIAIAHCVSKSRTRGCGFHPAVVLSAGRSRYRRDWPFTLALRMVSRFYMLQF